METQLDTHYQNKFVHANGIRLQYLDWGGDGPALIFLAGLGCSAHIYAKFAPRFTPRFHVIGMTRRGHGDSDYPETGYDVDTLSEDLLQFMDALHIDRAILAGHSMANVELSHFAALHPERVLKLVFLDASYDRTTDLFKSMMEKNPLRTIKIPGLNDDHYSMEDYAASVQRWYPALAAIWSEMMDEHLRHSVKTGPDGKIVDKMSDAIGAALNETLTGYKPEDSKIQAPVLSFLVIKGGKFYLSPDYMTEEQKAQVIEYFETVRPVYEQETAEQLKRDLPQARIVMIPNGHHYCFIAHEELVYEEMNKFLAS
jgi:non-heme chloroperoxidase